MFKKNDHVAVIGSWNDKGEIYVRRAIVKAWGKSVIRLEDFSTGKMFKRALDTQYVNRDVAHSIHIVADASAAELEAYAMKRGVARIAYEHAGCDHRLTIPAEESYYRAIRKRKSEIQETPTVRFIQGND